MLYNNTSNSNSKSNSNSNSVDVHIDAHMTPSRKHKTDMSENKTYVTEWMSLFTQL